MHWSYGCTAEPGDRYLCRGYREEVAMDRMPWEDWWAVLQEIAEEEDYRLGPPEWYRQAWERGMSPEKALERKEWRE